MSKKTTKLPDVKIGKTKVGGNNPVFIEAEIGINFDGKKDQAMQLIDVAAEAGCNAVKFQLFTAERMYTLDPGKYITATGKKRDIWDLIRENELPPAWIPELRNYAKTKKLEFFATVCDEVGGDILDDLKVDAFKIASYEITHLPLFVHMAKKGRPIIFSCGGANLSEVDETITTIKAQGLNKVILMHCMGQYPVPLVNVNLGIITTLLSAFPDVVIGYSDHSIEPTKAPRAAVALGAKMIEKHITLDRKLPGPDHAFAIEPKELKLMVEAIRDTEEKMKKGESIEVDPVLLGSSQRRPYQGEEFVRNFCYRRIFAIRDIKKGGKLNRNNLAVLRSGDKFKETMLLPRYLPILMGKRATANLKAGQGLTWKHVLSK